MTDDLQILFVSNYTSLRECISVVNANGKRIALVVDSEQRLSGTVTDGDIRRAILDNISLEETVGKLLDQKTGTKYAQPITAYQDASRTEFLALMQEHNVSHLPIVDQDGRVVDMVMLDQLVAKKDPPFQAVIMAGGRTDSANRGEVFIMRRLPGGEVKTAVFNLNDGLEDPALADWGPLQRFDIVFVPRSRIANHNLFVQQYIRGALPVEFSLFYDIAGNNR